MSHENGHHEAALALLEVNGAESAPIPVGRPTNAHKRITRVTARQKRDAAVAGAVVDAVVALLESEPMVRNAWGGVELIAKVKAMKGDGT